MKKLVTLLLVVTMVLGVLTGCTSSNSIPSTKAGESTAIAETTNADKPAATTEKTNKDLSILWSSGGNGEYVNYTNDYLTKTYGLNIDIEYNSKAHEILQPELIAGNPPDVVMVQHSFFNYYQAIQSGAFNAITKYLDLPVNGSNKTVREVANSDIIESTSVDGESYLLMSNMNVGGMYYNKTMFKEHGWEVPETWDEFIALCDKISTTTDIAPFAYPGLYPYYMNCFIFPQICSLGNGADSFNDFNNMKEGFWTSDCVGKAFKRIEYMRDKGYFLDSLTSLKHTEVQMEFINGKVAMIACGSWLQNEMADNWPDGFELAYMATPSGASANDEKYVVVSGNMFAFPAKAANQEWIGEFLQTYYSEESAEAVAKDCGVVISPAMVAENENVRTALSDSVIESYESANKNTKLYMLASIWYAEFWTNYQNTLAALVSGEISADEFCKTVENYAAEIRNDSDIVKYTVN